MILGPKSVGGSIEGNIVGYKNYNAKLSTAEEVQDGELGFSVGKTTNKEQGRGSWKRRARGQGKNSILHLLNSKKKRVVLEVEAVECPQTL